jgi:regulatory protein
MIPKRSLTKEQALQKARHYCAFQERTHIETREKLYSFGLHKNEVEEILAQLIEENYLNEERFAIQFAGGKFRIKHWGKMKIKYALKEKRISDYNIRKALEEIDGEEYRKQLEKMTTKKWNSVKTEQNSYLRMQKTRDYLIRKGFESGLVMPVLRKLSTES